MSAYKTLIIFSSCTSICKGSGQSNSLCQTDCGNDCQLTCYPSRQTLNVEGTVIKNLPGQQELQYNPCKSGCIKGKNTDQQMYSFAV